MGIKNTSGNQLAVVAIAGGTYTAHTITREYNNRTNSLGTAGATIYGFLDFFTYANISNAYFELTIEYYANA